MILPSLTCLVSLMVSNWFVEHTYLKSGAKQQWRAILIPSGLTKLPLIRATTHCLDCAYRELDKELLILWWPLITSEVFSMPLHGVCTYYNGHCFIPSFLCSMSEVGLNPFTRQVVFGQLLGMCDHLTLPLGVCTLSCSVAFVC